MSVAIASVVYIYIYTHIFLFLLLLLSSLLFLSVLMEARGVVGFRAGGLKGFSAYFEIMSSLLWLQALGVLG